uniref:Uncharacterized protein n=1 Tax=Aplanochytrium stocchinoi TaxID=215587 RepID=A0A7S3LNE8_9STRA
MGKLDLDLDIDTDTSYYFSWLCLIVLTPQLITGVFVLPALGLGLAAKNSTQERKVPKFLGFNIRKFSTALLALGVIFILLDIRIHVGDLKRIDDLNFRILDFIIRTLLLFVAEDFFLFWMYRLSYIIISKHSNNKKGKNVGGKSTTKSTAAASAKRKRQGKSSRHSYSRIETSNSPSQVEEDCDNYSDNNVGILASPVVLFGCSKPSLLQSVSGELCVVLSLISVWPHPRSIIIWLAARVMEAYDVAIWEICEQTHLSIWRPSFFLPYGSTKMHRQVDASIFLILLVTLVHRHLGGVLQFPLQIFVLYINVIVSVFDHQSLPNTYLTVIQCLCIFGLFFI